MKKNKKIQIYLTKYSSFAYLDFFYIDIIVEKWSRIIPKSGSIKSYIENPTPLPGKSQQL